MTIIKNKRHAVVIKLSPTGRLVLAWRPSKYSKTAQQRAFGEIARKCGAQKGVTRETLIREVFPCIRREWDRRMGRSSISLDREIREAKEARNRRVRL